MERGVVIGGILISASFLFAVLLNHSADSPLPIAGPGKEVGPQACPGEDQDRVSDESPGEDTDKRAEEARPPCRRHHARE